MPRHFDIELKKTFKTDFIGFALFYKYPISLRYQLSSDYKCGNTHMFIQAMERSKKLFEDIFHESENIYVNLIFSREKNSYKAKPYLPLLECGFSLPDDHERKIVKVSKSQIDEYGLIPGYWYQYAFKVKMNDLNVHAVLWAVMSAELSIQPSGNIVAAYFVDFEREIIFHPYDDRGLDIIASDKNTLLPIYKKYRNWIVEWNLEEIQEKFE